MNAFQIKLIAIITMIIDHMGLFFFPQLFWLRIIGRLSFPLFAWFIANGAYHTHNIKIYLFRLFLVSLLSQIPYLLANKLIDPTYNELNVLCTLFFGLVAIYCIQKESVTIGTIGTILCIIAAQLLQTDYGGFGVALVVVCYLFFNNFWKLVIAQFFVFFAQFLFFQRDVGGMVELFGLVSLIFISCYNNQPGPRTKYLFYLFYPLQYVVYYFLLLF